MIPKIFEVLGIPPERNAVLIQQAERLVTSYPTPADLIIMLRQDTDKTETERLYIIFNIGRWLGQHEMRYKWNAIVEQSNKEREDIRAKVENMRFEDSEAQHGED